MISGVGGGNGPPVEMTGYGATSFHGAFSTSWGYIFPIIALGIVIAMIFGTRFFTEKVRSIIANSKKKSGESKKHLDVIETVALDQMRRVSLIEVSDRDGNRSSVVVLTGGDTDVCLGWLPAAFSDDHQETAEVGGAA